MMIKCAIFYLMFSMLLFSNVGINIIYAAVIMPSIHVIGDAFTDINATLSSFIDILANVVKISLVVTIMALVFTPIMSLFKGD